MQAGGGYVIETSEQRGWLARALILCGGTCLFLAVATDFAAVVVRHVGHGLFGSTELVQWLIVGIVSTSLVFATLHDAHAAVQLLAARLGPRAKSIQHRATEAVTALVLLVMLTGSAWVFILLLPLDERSDLLGLPIAPARFLWSAALLIAVCLTAAGAWRKR
jgi:TRAP-type C4-dicarboxylate transport system permease small subunit